MARSKFNLGLSPGAMASGLIGARTLIPGPWAYSSVGRVPASAAPIPAPTKADTDSGVSGIGSGPNSSSPPSATRIR